MCNLSRKRFLHKVLLEKITKPETRIEIVFSIYSAYGFEVLGNYFFFQKIHIKKPTNNNKKTTTNQYPRPPVSLVWFNSWLALLTFHHNKPRTKIPKSFFIKLSYQFHLIRSTQKLFFDHGFEQYPPLLLQHFELE